ncbi:baseplate J/gp47 family protein [Hymenobacter cavernae]|uniref:Baseplate protein J-like domain-containing protein n=1 Tax=Hymenobacter cavernae TaxID=2044852 RepID=A0ABQ1UQW3_9BACT|nr:baseplate J/gp47 family protein [Hymenobacter cavernae]GGF24397.1 hypothetical protein GCM10011383_40050 [Hymenobacter cavernae]
MSTNCPDTNPLQREGLSQPQRRLAALQPAYVSLDERSLEDLLQFAKAYAKEAKVRLFDLAGTPDNGEAWRELMNFENYVQPAELDSRSDIEPHFALFLTFLQLFGHAQQHLNSLTKRHLDFYYKEVLQLTNQAPVPDRVHVVFELAKNVAEQIVPVQTELDAGRDPKKQPLLYESTENRTVNQAKIAHLRTLYVHSDQTIYYAPAANTQDGIAKPLDKDDPTWNAFGPKRKPLVSCEPSTPETINLPEAQLGFALASSILLLAEGERTITVKLALAQAASLPAGIKLRTQLSGAKAWIEAGEVELKKTGNDLTFTVTLPTTEKQAVVAYNAALLDGGYVTTAPVLRCYLSCSADYAALRNLTLQSAKIDVSVTGLKKTLALENDLGSVNPEKPFMPFGPTPVVGSTLYVGSPEAVAKPLTSVTVHLPEWIGKPSSWSSYYSAYGGSYTNQSNCTATATLQNNSLTGSRTAALFSAFSSLSVPDTTTTTSVGSSYLTGYSGFSLYKDYVFSGGIFQAASPQFYLANNLALSETSVSDSLLKIKLNRSFGHRAYPKKLTQAILADPKGDIPNPPYTPMVKELTLDYLASTGVVPLTSKSAADFTGRDLQLFHNTPFGQAEEHAFLKQNLAFLDNTSKNNAFLLPQLALGGTFLVGLQNIGALESVTVLFQVAEGSANPERAVATVSWSVLSQNQWRRLTEEEVLSDATNHLLTSGIIQFYLPPEIRADNTLLEPGLVWLKAELLTAAGSPAPIDSVSNLVALHPQASLAIFHDHANDPSHYDAALPADTISKTRQSLAGLKAVHQPYASFGGRPAEPDAAFYTRVSERLRHKQRTVTIWDYEHLILQSFPGVYKVKCLNHSRLDASFKLHELAPGYVTVVVVPDLRIAHAINPLEPKVDLNTLAAIQDFLQHHAGKLVGIQVVNPAYERVKLHFKVEFLRGYAFATYRKKLQRDLLAYLSPWAFDTSAEIPFGGTLTKSAVINYIERLHYVDFVTDLTMQHFTTNPTVRDDNEVITASDARAVLVSCSQHDIQLFTEPCTS